MWAMDSRSEFIEGLKRAQIIQPYFAKASAGRQGVYYYVPYEALAKYGATSKHQNERGKYKIGKRN